MNLRNLLASVAIAATTLTATSAFAAPETATATANGAVTIIRPITIGSAGSLDFGTIVRPTSGSGTVSISQAGARTVGAGLAAVGSGGSRPVFTINGEGGQSYDLNIPASFALTSGANTLTVTLDPSLADGSHTLSGSLGGAGSATLNVGGQITVTDATSTGAYAGSFDVTVTYN
jgi:hypothetical protein